MHAQSAAAAVLSLMRGSIVSCVVASAIIAAMTMMALQSLPPPDFTFPIFKKNLILQKKPGTINLKSTRSRVMLAGGCFVQLAMT
ncbi:hypothetical protein FHS85_004463 [Rhodoligotrophos appendicifer]